MTCPECKGSEPSTLRRKGAESTNEPRRPPKMCACTYEYGCVYLCVCACRCACMCACGCIGACMCACIMHSYGISASRVALEECLPSRNSSSHYKRASQWTKLHIGLLYVLYISIYSSIKYIYIHTFIQVYKRQGDGKRHRPSRRTDRPTQNSRQ